MTLKEAVKVESAIETAAPSHSVVPRRMVSMSEAADDYAATEDGRFKSGVLTAPTWISSWFEAPFRMADPKTGRYLSECTGWAMDSSGKGPLVQAGSYIGACILRMALVDAGCKSAACSNEVYGMRPSSLLTLASSIAGVVCAFILPVFGAIVDHTKYRKMVGTVSGLATVILTGMEISISIEKNNYLFVLILDSLQSSALLIHVTATFAYLPELTTDYSVVPTYTSHFTTRQYFFQVTYGILVIIVGQSVKSARNLNPLETSQSSARAAAGIAFIYGLMFIGYAWTFLMRSRPALSKIPEGSTLLTTSFVQVANTTRTVYNRYTALSWFLFSLLWSPEAGAGVVQSLAVTFLTVSVQYTPLDIAILNVILLFAHIPGSMFSRIICNYITPLNSYRISMAWLAMMMGFCMIFVNGPQDRYLVYFYGVWAGLASGWTYASQRVLFVTLTPRGQETEMMGLFFFVGQILGWLPPFIFTALNETGNSIKWSLGIVSIFSAFSVLCTLPMGSYEEAVRMASTDSEGKMKEIVQSVGTATHDISTSSHASPDCSIPDETAVSAAAAAQATDAVVIDSAVAMAMTAGAKNAKDIDYNDLIAAAASADVSEAADPSEAGSDMDDVELEETRDQLKEEP